MNRFARLSAAKNYALYYGAGMEEELRRYDLVVVEPAGQNQTSVLRMQDSGALVLAYLSVMEIFPHAPEIRLLRADDFLNSNGHPLTNKEYGNYLVDLRSKRWAGLLLHKAGNLLENFGYDGLFLDTIGDVESATFASGLRDELLMAATDIVGQIRHVYPEHVIIQNNGLEKLCYLTAGFINGICWENPPFGRRASNAWVQAVVSRLENLQERYGLKILLLWERKIEEGIGSAQKEPDSDFLLAREVANNKKFLFCAAPFRYIGSLF